MVGNAARMRTRVIAVVAIGLGLVLGGSTAALSSGTLTSASSTSLTAVHVVRDANPAQTTSTSFVDVPGATTTFTVPAGTRALLIARFSASSTCPGSIPDAGCFVRILINGVEALPSGVNLTSFDSETSSNGITARQEAHMIERSKGGLTPGTYVVQVQMAANTTATFALVNWNLTVERWKV